MAPPKDRQLDPLLAPIAWVTPGLRRGLDPDVSAALDFVIRLEKRVRTQHRYVYALERRVAAHTKLIDAHFTALEQRLAALESVIASRRRIRGGVKE